MGQHVNTQDHNLHPIREVMATVMQDPRVHRDQQDHPIPEDHLQAVRTREDQATVTQAARQEAAHQVLILHHQEVAVAAVHLQPIQHLQGAVLRVAQAAVAAEAAAAEVVAEAAVAAEPDAGNNKSGFLN